MATTTIREAQGTKCFWVNNGPIIKNLPELIEALEKMSVEKFNYHNKRNGNDFAVWVEWVLGEKDLAKKLARLKSRRGCIKAIKKYIC